MSKITRRNFLKTAVFLTLAVFSLLMAACGAENTDAAQNNQDATGTVAASADGTPTMPQLVTTDKGVLMGTVTDGTYIFKGIPYATAERFMQPVEVEPWQGIRTAMNYGETCPNGQTTVSVSDYSDPSGTDNQPNETCQYLNVWTRSVDPNAKKPVLFWIHGGGWFSGSSNELSYYDGANLSASQDIVFVSINHRLNVLGYTELSSYGEEYKNSGNAGVADMVMALKWVQKNIANFGGDPDNVTIMGQSGGGAKVSTLMGLPAAQGLFHKAVISSGGVSGIDLATAQAAGVALVEKTKAQYNLDTDAEALDLLKTMPYDDLNKLYKDTGVGEGPVVDGEYYPAITIDEEGNLSKLAQKIPVMVTTTFSEISESQFTFTTIQPAVAAISADMPVDAYIPTFFKAYMSEETIQQKLDEKFGVNKEAALAAFRKGFPGHPDVDALFVDNSTLTTDNLMILDVLAKKSEAPAYRGFFAYDLPLFGGIPAMHTGGDLPFFFNNMDCIDYMIAGDEVTAQKVATEASTALANFARTGNPSTSEHEWPAYTTEKKAAMIFDTNTEVRYDFDTEFRGYLAAQADIPYNPQN